MARKASLLIFCAALNLQGCVESYPFTKDEKTAHLVSLTSSSPMICANDKMYSLNKPPNQNYFVIPADQRITLFAYGNYEGYPISYSCSPRVSLIPSEGQSYLMDLIILRNGCAIEVVRENEKSKMGVRRELTLGPSNCDTTKSSTNNNDRRADRKRKKS